MAMFDSSRLAVLQAQRNSPKGNMIVIVFQHFEKTLVPENRPFVSLLLSVSVFYFPPIPPSFFLLYS